MMESSMKKIRGLSWLFVGQGDEGWEWSILGKVKAIG
jgi:hypothetical protein